MRGLGQAELGGERECPIGGRDRLRVGDSDDDAESGLPGVGGDELGSGRLRLEQFERLEERLLLPRVAQAVEHGHEPAQRAARCERVAPLAMAGEGLVERLTRLPQPVLRSCRLRPALQQQPPLLVILRAELEGACERLLGPVDVEAERPLAGQRQLPDRLRLERAGVGRAGGAGELERGQVVVGENVGQVLCPLARHRLEPGGRALVPLGARRAGDLRVTDVSDQRVPEPELRLPRHRRAAGGPDELLSRQLMQCLLHLARVASAPSPSGRPPRTPFPPRKRPAAGPCAPG